MNTNLSRASLLYEQGRYDLAVKEAQREIADNPDNPFGHTLLALSLSKLKQHGDAIREAQFAVHLAPDEGTTHYVLGSVLDDVGRLKEAEAAAREAIRLDPAEADYFALLASIRLQQRQWADAVQIADQGLAFDPDHLGNANLRAMALVQLGRRQEASAAIQGTLAKAPDDAATHANQGWAMLHQGDPAAGMEHFREALRINPEMAWARQGILEALRARNPIYRLMLRYFLWMSRFRGNARMGIVLGAWLGYQGVRQASRMYPALAPYLLPLIVLYLAFWYLSWTAKPLFNLMLRLDKMGRHALTRDQVLGSNWFGACLLLALACLAGHLLTQRLSLLFAAAAALGLTIPVSATFLVSPGKQRLILGLYTAGLALIALVATVGMAWINADRFAALIPIYAIGLVAFIWLSNLVASRSDYR